MNKDYHSFTDFCRHHPNCIRFLTIYNSKFKVEYWMDGSNLFRISYPRFRIFGKRLTLKQFYKELNRFKHQNEFLELSFKQDLIFKFNLIPNDDVD